MDLSWNRKKINRFLRALDNGNLTNKARIKILENNYEILFYEINDNLIKLKLNDMDLMIGQNDENNNVSLCKR